MQRLSWVTGSPRDQARARPVHPRKQPSWPAVGPSDSGRSRFTLRSLKPAYPSHSRLISTLSLGLLRQILVEECRQLAEVLLRLGRIGITRILRMRLAFEHEEIRDDTGLTQLAMHTYRVGQEQVTRARCENGRRETGEVAIHRRKLRILQVMTVGIELRGIAEPAVITHQNVVDLLVGEKGVAGLRHIGPWSAGRRRGGKRQNFRLGAPHPPGPHPPAGRGSADCHLLRGV